MVKSCLLERILINWLDSVKLFLSAVVFPRVSGFEVRYLSVSPKLCFESYHLYVLFLPCSFDEMVDLVCVAVPIEVNHCIGSGAPARDRPLLLGTSWINEFCTFV